MTSTSKVKIASLQIENVKRVQAVDIEPAESGLTIIGGNNKQGKTSCLNAIMSALGGAKYDPTNAVKDGEKGGSVTITMNNGLKVQKTYTEKGSYLKVEDPKGKKSGQSLLNEFVSSFALDLGQFINANDKTKATILLEIIGVDLAPYEEKHKKLYADREAVGTLKRRAEKHAEAMPYDEEAGTELFEASDIMRQLEAVVSHNAAVKQARADASNLKRRIEDQDRRVEELVEKLAAASTELKKLQDSLAKADDPGDLKDDADIKAKLSEIEEKNARVRQNLERQKALSEAEGHAEEYRSLTEQIEQNQKELHGLLDGADMPLKNLSVQDGVLTFKGQPWDCMSGAEQMVVAAAICQRVNPNMGFVLIDRIEQMDMPTLETFGRWLDAQGLQAITTRVSTGPECSIIIEDGVSKPATGGKKNVGKSGSEFDFD